MKAEVEVERLESVMKEIAFKKQAELEEAARDKTMTLINSGCIEQTELHVDMDNQTATEVERLDQLKVSRVKEMAFKKQAELGEIFAHAHIKIDMDAARETITSSLVSGDIEPTELLFDMDNQIERAKKDALSRKDILDLVKSWLSACEEARWLEDYYQVIIIFLV
jgi:hypothetical protein